MEQSVRGISGKSVCVHRMCGGHKIRGACVCGGSRVRWWTKRTSLNRGVRTSSSHTIHKFYMSDDFRWLGCTCTCIGIGQCWSCQLYILSLCKHPGHLQRHSGLLAHWWHRSLKETHTHTHTSVKKQTNLNFMFFLFWSSFFYFKIMKKTGGTERQTLTQRLNSTSIFILQYCECQEYFHFSWQCVTPLYWKY